MGERESFTLALKKKVTILPFAAQLAEEMVTDMFSVWTVMFLFGQV